ncbi:MAG TPA: hypothetical protein PKK48_00920 [Phycisphaerae bacterium]|nr:hypothetical protein [Phycisphaerae bacterium]
MGEYIRKTQDGPQVAKLGTCESWGYIRRDECFLLREKGFHYDGDWNYIDSNDRQGPIFRFPWPDEDSFIQNGPDAIIAEMNKRDMYYGKCYPCPREVVIDAEHGSYFFSPKCREGSFGYSVGNWMLPCPNSKDADGIGEWSNGNSRFQIRILGERQNENGWYTVFSCPYCGRSFAMVQEDVAKLELPLEIMERVRAFIPYDADE